ncbi:MAG: tRNA 2-thiouridine(34) synthase MnmA, partial [Marinilabiliales bacterium]
MGKARVLVAMSGGIDSSITAMMLREQGYDLVGITMKTWDYHSSGVSTKETGCCSLDSIQDARNMAENMDFPHYMLDLREPFEKHIVSNFVDEYLKGRTPNPCVLCNTHIKWDALLEKADELECEYIATGHYARIRKEADRYIISRALDDTKDQSYVLWGLNQDCLSRTIMPLGDYRKEDIRKLAKERGFDNLAHKRESYEICFVPDDDYRKFLENKVPDLNARIGEGDFVLKDGTLVGKHRGYPFYTIGQRKGLNIALG